MTATSPGNQIQNQEAQMKKGREQAKPTQSNVETNNGSQQPKKLVGIPTGELDSTKITFYILKSST